MKRRSFLGAVAGLIAAPSLIEKIRAESVEFVPLGPYDPARDAFLRHMTKLADESRARTMRDLERQYYGQSEIERHLLLNGSWK